MLNFFGSLAKSNAPGGKAPAGTKVIIVAGQSNAGGEQYSQPSFQILPNELQGDLSGVNRIFEYDTLINHDDFSVVNDTYSNRIGPDLNLGFLYQKYHNENIYIIKYAYGATGFRQNTGNPDWNVNTTNELFDGLKDCITTAMQKLTANGLNPTIRGFVWYQGEEDAFADEEKDVYKLNEQAFFSQLRSDLNLPDMKIYSVLISTLFGPPANWKEIRNAKIENETEIPNYYTVDADGLQFESFYGGIHLTKAGQIELGRKIFEKLKNN